MYLHAEQSDLFREYLRLNQKLFAKLVACYSGACQVSIRERKKS